MDCISVRASSSYWCRAWSCVRPSHWSSEGNLSCSFVSVMQFCLRSAAARAYLTTIQSPQSVCLFAGMCCHYTEFLLFRLLLRFRFLQWCRLCLSRLRWQALARRQLWSCHCASCCQRLHWLKDFGCCWQRFTWKVWGLQRGTTTHPPHHLKIASFASVWSLWPFSLRFCVAVSIPLGTGSFSCLVSYLEVNTGLDELILSSLLRLSRKVWLIRDILTVKDWEESLF